MNAREVRERKPGAVNVHAHHCVPSVVAVLVDAPRAYRWLDAAQLVKHALGLVHTYTGRAVTLLYLYWEPLNAADFWLFAEHRRETTAFAGRVVSPHLDFESMTYNDLWASWDACASRWVSAHLRDLRARFRIEI